MEIVKLELRGVMSSNCYLLISNNDCVVIDPGFEDYTLYDYLKNRQLNLEKIILTHGHFDHWGGLKKLRTLYPDIPLYASTLDHLWYEVGPNNYYGYQPKIDFDLNNFDTLDILGKAFNIIKTPGHSAGSISLNYDNHVFVGDVLFKESIGRTDLLQGSKTALFHSIKKLYSLPENTSVYPGHGPTTTIKYEKAHNPFVRG